LDLPPDIRSDISARVQKMNRRIAKARKSFSDRRPAPKRKPAKPLYGIGGSGRLEISTLQSDLGPLLRERPLVGLVGNYYRPYDKRPRWADSEWEVE